MDQSGQHLPEIPRFYVDEKKRSKFQIFAIFVLSLLVLCIPIGVYVASQKTTISPQAAAPAQASPDVSLEAELVSPNVNFGQEFGVNIYVKSDLDEANLAIAKLKFPTDGMEVVKIDTSNTFVKNWLETSFDNSQGTISLIGGSGNPGFQTSPSGPTRLLMATIFFKARANNPNDLNFEPDSQILRNSDNINILKNAKPLTININNLAQNIIQPVSTASADLTLKLSQPTGGQIYSYFKPIQINWDSTNLDKILAINLFLNGKNFGKITSNLEASDGSYSWVPQDTLLLPYAASENSFQVSVTARNKAGQVLIGFNDGPFSILPDSDSQALATKSASLNNNMIDIDGSGNLDFKDISIIFSNFARKKLTNQKADINGDGVVNDIDFWFAKKQLISQQIIKS